jgi:hypothetical protein
VEGARAYMMLLFAENSERFGSKLFDRYEADLRRTVIGKVGVVLCPFYRFSRWCRWLTTFEFGRQ